MIKNLQLIYALLVIFFSEVAMAEVKTVVLAGGCFWCMESVFQEKSGVLSVVSGYTGDTQDKANYQAVSLKQTDHLEAVKITYDPLVVDYESLLAVFWDNIDPLDNGGQFVDRGPQYKTAIFYQSQKEKELATASKMQLEKKLQEKVVTNILPAQAFYEAEHYHQDYYKNNSTQYKSYYFNSGRPSRLNQLKQQQ